MFIIFIRPKYCALPVQHGNYAKERKLAKACDRCCFLLENAPKDTARHGLSFSILSHLLLCLTQLKPRGKRHFVRSTTNDNDGPALCSIFSEAEEKKERRGGGGKEKEKKKRKKFEKRENNQREHESSPRMSSQTETWFNFVLGVGWLTFFLAHLTFPGQSLLLAEHCVLEASSVDLIYLSKLEYR